MANRLAQLGLVARYGTRQLIGGVQGTAYPIAVLHNLAWFDSDAKKLPTASVEDLFPGITKLPIQMERGLPHVRGNVTIDELAVIALLCRQLKPKVIFEFGTFNGRTTLNLAANAPDDAKVYTLDLADPDQMRMKAEDEDNDYHLRERSGMFFQGSRYESRIEQRWGDSALFDETPFHGQVDLAFVDAAHSYEYAKSDSEKALAMVRPGGMILWHDYCVWFPGVYQYLHELLSEYPIKHIEGTHMAILASR